MKTIFFLFSFCFAAICQGQNTLQYVPADAPVVLSLNLGNLGQRVNLNTLKQYDFYKAMIKEMEQSPLEPGEQEYMRKFLDSPADLGFDMLRPFYFFVKEKEDTTFFTMVMEMGNKAKYEAGLMELHPDIYEEHLSEKTGYQIWQNKTETYVWNEDVILNIWSEYTPSFDDYSFEEDDTWAEDSIYEDIETLLPPEEIMESENTVDDTEEEIEEIEFDSVEDMPMGEDDSFEIDTSFNEFGDDEWDDDFGLWGVDTREATARWADELMGKNIGIPISSNANFRNSKAQKADIHLWMDYGYFLDEYKSTAGMGMGAVNEKMAPFIKMAEGFVDKLYSDTYLSWGLSFEQGKMAVHTQQFFNRQLQDFHAGVRDVKFNKKFFRYIEGGEDLFGYAYFNYNIKNTIEEGKPLLHNMLNSSPTYGQAASDAVKIMGIFIDEEAIANLLKGDMMVAFSGMQKVMVTETTYDFDEDFNYVEKDTTMEQTHPKFTALATFGNRKDIMKFIDLGLHSEVLTRDGANYKMKEPTSGLEFHLGLHKNMLMLTNNRELLTSKLEKGISKKKRLSKKHRKLLCENSSMLYWDIPNTKRQTADPNSTDTFSPMYYVDVFGKQFESLSWKSTKKVEGSLNNEFDLNFKNKGTNSLEQFFIFINDIWLEFEGGAKI